MSPRPFSILPLLFVLFAFSNFADALPSNIDSNKTDQADEDWTKLTECSDFLAAVKRASKCYRRCILDRIRNVNEGPKDFIGNIFPALESAVNACVSISPWRCLDIRRIQGPTMYRIEKHVYAIPLPPPPPPPTIDSPPVESIECTAVFHEIHGNDWETPDLNMSFDLLKLAPGCRLHLAHPIDDRNFSTIGQVHPLIISKEIRNPTKVELQGRAIENVTTMNVHDFLETFDDSKKPSFIDYLWMMDPWYCGFGDTFQTYSLMLDGPPRDVTICQIMSSVPPYATSHHTRNGHRTAPEGGFKRLLTNVLEKSGFIPLRSELDLQSVYPRFREFYFNMASPYCVAKFIAPQFDVTACGKKATIHGKEKVIKGQFEIDAELIRIE